MPKDQPSLTYVVIQHRINQIRYAIISNKPISVIQNLLLGFNAEYLLSSGYGPAPKLSYQTKKSCFLPSLLHRAVEVGHLEATKLLVSIGAVINAIDLFDETPLDRADCFRKKFQASGESLLVEHYSKIYNYLSSEGGVSAKRIFGPLPEPHRKAPLGWAYKSDITLPDSTEAKKKNNSTNGFRMML